ncbi:MAG TPA: hypothetical protein DD670_08715 [Planctomycetaceae bacterium]|nr:hypothetical protein [Planctomycetaceae bacterium]
MNQGSFWIRVASAGTAFGLLAAIAALAVDGYANPVASRDGIAATLRVGTFDSRAVAVAFTASKMFREELEQWEKERREAEARGDVAALERIEARAKQRQKLAHHQGFGTASVEEILRRVGGRLPEIADKAGVDMIVSKWAITYRSSDVEVVDVTDLLVEPFEPNQRTRRVIEQLREKSPIPHATIELQH